MRRAARIDANQPEIVKALESVGCTVRSLAALGKDCEDLLVGFRGVNYLMEVKNPESSGKHQGASKISDGQRKQQAEWQGQTAIVWTVDEALAVIGFRVLDNSNLRMIETPELNDAMRKAVGAWIENLKQPRQAISKFIGFESPP